MKTSLGTHGVDLITSLIARDLDNGKKTGELLIKEFLAFYSWAKLRSWMIGVLIALIAGLAGLLTSVLFLKQNNLIRKQNELLLTQTLVETQQENENYIRILDNLFSNISNSLIDTSRTLPDELIRRIVIISKVIHPNITIDRDLNIKRGLYSYEKRDLLIGLLDFDLSQETYNKIFRSADFSHTNLQNVVLHNKDLSYINLNYSLFDNSVLDNVSFKDSKFRNISFKNSEIIGNSTFDGIDFFKSIFDSTKLGDEVVINCSSFDSVSFNSVKFQNLTCAHSKFHGCTFNKADLRFIKLHDSEFKNTIMDKAIVPNRYWFESLKKVRIVGIDELSNRYEIISDNENGENKFFLIRSVYLSPGPVKVK